MNRNEALKFIRDNSRLIVSTQINNKKDWGRSEPFEPNYLEHRMGNNGTPFILHDWASNGWDIYFISGNNKISETLEQFSKQTGCEIKEPAQP